VSRWSGEYEGESKLVICELIVAYCNGTDIADSSFSVVKKRNIVGVPGLSGIVQILMTESYFHFPKTKQDPVEELERYRRKFCAAVRWLCSPKNPQPAVSPNRLKKLVERGELNWGRYPEIDKGTEEFVRYFDDHALRHFRKVLYLRDGNLRLDAQPLHLVDLFCYFLLRECQDKSPGQMPLRLCQRCGKLFTAQGVKKFCSEKCHDKAFWTKERRADYQYLGRLEDYSPTDLFRKLQQPKVKTRLKEIENRWSTWNKVAEKIRSINTTATRK
jgi:hypothetical protein